MMRSSYVVSGLTNAGEGTEADDGRAFWLAPLEACKGCAEVRLPSVRLPYDAGEEFVRVFFAIVSATVST